VSTAELLYGKTLRIPKEFFDHEDIPNHNLSWNRSENLSQHIKLTPDAYHIRNRSFLFKDLHTCMHVFLRDDTAKPPLEQSYTGPHPVMERISERVSSSYVL